MTLQEFQNDIRAGIPDRLPAAKPYDKQINHAPKRKEILTPEEQVLAIKNALRYFPAKHHALLAKEFAEELRKYGRIYMYRLRPDYEMYARPIDQYPCKCRQAAAIMLMIQNNLDKAVAQHPHELITYGGNGAVFQNWAQYRLTMKYLSEMTDSQTLAMYSGHPLGLFPSHPDAPRVVVTNGMVIPNYSKPDDWERMNALGVSQYGQMTAGSYMYIGPQGIVHGTTITVMNAARKRFTADRRDARGMLFVSSGLGGMSGAQPKAGTISGVVSVIAEINPKAAQKRYEQGWVDELHHSLDELIPRIRRACREREAVSMAYVGNVVDLWERLAAEEIPVDLGSDQTSLHNPWAGGYYPVDVSYEASNKMMAEEPARFRECVQESLRRQVDAINKLTARGMYFFDYGNAFLLEASRAGAAVMGEGGRFRYPSYVQDIMGPMFFDYGFGPFRWVCTSGKPEDLELTDRLAAEVLEEIRRTAPAEIAGQLDDNIHWIREAGRNRLVVGSQARILYADSEGRTKIAQAFNRAIVSIINYPIVQTTDNEKYLHKTFSENDNTLGTIFLNADNNANFNDRNSIIYGHRMKDGSMFRKLDEYKDKSFWEANPYFYIYTPDGREIVYHIYSAATVKDTDDVYLTGFENDEAYRSYLDMTKRIAIYDTGVEVTTADSVVTLSTCTSASDEHRFVVIGVKEQENQMGQTK